LERIIKRYARAMKALAISMSIITNQRADAIAHNPYAGWVAGHCAMVNPYLSKFDTIGNRPLSDTVNGIEEAFWIADKLHGKPMEPVQVMREWLEEDGCRSHCDDTPECLNFAYVTTLVFCKMCDRDNPDSAARVREWLERFDFKSKFRCAVSHNVRLDVEKHWDGFGLEALITQLINLQRWHAMKINPQAQDLAVARIKWGAEEVHSYSLALLTIIKASGLSGIHADAAGASSSSGPKARNSVVAANAVDLVYSRLNQGGPESSLDLALAAYMAKVALGDDETTQSDPDNPATIYLELRKLLYQFADKSRELENLSACTYTVPHFYVGRVMRNGRYPPVVGGRVMLEALKYQPRFPWEVAEDMKELRYTDLPKAPAIQIVETPEHGEEKKSEYGMHLDRTLYLDGDRWKVYVEPGARCSKYELQSAILETKRDRKRTFALIAGHDPWSPVSADQRHETWVLLEPGAAQVKLENEAAARLIDGEEGGVHAILALYGSRRIYR
jgi:hypothetical protein